MGRSEATGEPVGIITDGSGRPTDRPLSAKVYYKLPHEDEYTQLVGYGSAVRTVSSLDELPHGGGYVIAPFTVTPDCPILWIEPDMMSRHPLDTDHSPSGWRVLDDDTVTARTAYVRSFAAVRESLLRGDTDKVVLSRRLHLKLEPVSGGDRDMETLIYHAKRLFDHACQRYPECFVTLWWTAQTGAWLIATPEPLLQYAGDEWHTVALAGTQPRPGDPSARTWSAKNHEEQAIVARFVKSVLEASATQVRTSPVETVSAGRIEHLCTHFHFRLPDTPGVATSLLQQLHPTPAVCGMPREAARDVILKAEPEPRRYYAGFSGPMGLHGATRLYVSLRCMQLQSSQATLYAGGGLMPESREADEWEETQRKLLTMRDLF